MKPSKNKRRKTRRAAYHRIMNSISRSADDPEALRSLQRLKEWYFREVDSLLDSMDRRGSDRQRRDEKAFVRDILRVIENSGWITIYRHGQGEVQIKSDMCEYIAARMSCPGPAAEAAGPSTSNDLRTKAAEHLYRRAIRTLQPKHV